MTIIRYKVIFTPVGWHVVDTVEARDPVAQFGSGADEYARARGVAEEMNVDEHYKKALAILEAGR